MGCGLWARSQRDSSISARLAQALERVAEEEEGYAEPRRGMLNDPQKGFNLGTKGKIRWSRDSVHER